MPVLLENNLVMLPAASASTLWASQSPGYLPALPRHAGYGFDSYGGSGRDGSEGRVVVFLLDDFTSGSAVDAAYLSYTRIRHGNIEGAAAYKVSNPSTPMIVVPIKAGTINKRDDVRLGSYIDYYGQFAPGNGVLWKETTPSTTISFGAPGSSASHQRWWHGDFRAGDTAGGIPSGNRDSGSFGGTETDGTNKPSQICWINNFFGWSVDELGDGYNGGDLCTFLYNVFGEPLHKSIHDDTGTPDDGVGVDAHGYGVVVGPGYRWGRICFSRNLFAHIQSRQPYVAAEKFAYANNIIYNPGDTDGNTATGITLVVDYDAAAPYASGMLSNIIGNLIVKGPDGASSFNAIYSPADATQQPTGSQGFVSKNAVSGWTYANQDALKAGTFVTGWSQSSLLTTAWPAGWGSSLEGIQPIGSATNPNDFSSSDMLAFAQLMAQSVGPLPGRRTSADRAGVIANHVVARLSSGGQGQCVNSVDGTSNQTGWPNVSLRFAPNAGGWPSMGSTSVDPFSPGSAWYSALPLNGSAPDDRVQLTGTFSNGLSKIGYTALEVWAIEQHWYVGGK